MDFVIDVLQRRKASLDHAVANARKELGEIEARAAELRNDLDLYASADLEIDEAIARLRK